MKQFILLIAFILLASIGCEKQPVYEPIHWDGNYSYNNWVVSIDGDQVTISDNTNELTIIDSDFKGADLFITAKQELSNIVYLYEFEGILINGTSHNRNDHYINANVLIYKGNKYYGQAFWRLREY